MVGLCHEKIRRVNVEDFDELKYEGKLTKRKTKVDSSERVHL